MHYLFTTSTTTTNTITTTTTAAAAAATKISPFLVWLYGKHLKHVECQCLSPVMLESDADYEDHFGYIC
jgi:hypothetical protein